MARNSAAVTHRDKDGPVRERRERAFRLRTELRMSYARIAQAMRDENWPDLPEKYDDVSAFKDVKVILEEFRQARLDAAETYVEDQILRHERNYETAVAMLAPLQRDVSRGNPSAVNAALKVLAEMRHILDLEARLLGIYKQPEEKAGDGTTNILMLGNGVVVDMNNRASLLALARTLMTPGTVVEGQVVSRDDESAD